MVPFLLYINIDLKNKIEGKIDIMGMFDNYGNNSYTAYNLTPPNISRAVLTNYKTPLYTTDKLGNIYRFFWVEGEKFNLKLKATQKIRVPKDSILFTTTKVVPTVDTISIPGGKCYNLADYISWTCTFVEKTKEGKTIYKWEKDVLFECLKSGGQEVELTPSMIDKLFIAKVLNFRREVVYVYGTDDFVLEIPINDQVVKDLKQGQYFIDLFLEDESEESSYFIKEYPISILGDIDRLKEIIDTNNYFVDRKTIQGRNFQYEWYPIQDGNFQIEWHSVQDIIEVPMPQWDNL